MISSFIIHYLGHYYCHSCHIDHTDACRAQITLSWVLLVWIRSGPVTYIDHSIGSDAEKGGSLIDRLDLFSPLHRDFQTLEFTQGTLQGSPMLGNQIIACTEVIKLADKYLQGALNLTAVRLGCGLLISRVIWKGKVRGHTYTSWTSEDIYLERFAYLIE